VDIDLGSIQPRTQVISSTAVNVNADTLCGWAEATGTKPLPAKVEGDETPPTSMIGLDDEAGGARFPLGREILHVVDQNLLLTLRSLQLRPALPIEALILTRATLTQKRDRAEDGIKVPLDHGQD